MTRRKRYVVEHILIGISQWEKLIEDTKEVCQMSYFPSLRVPSVPINILNENQVL